MVNLHRFCLASTLALLALTACSNSQPSATENSPPSSPAAASPENTTAATKTNAKDTVTQMKGYLAESIKAVQANDLAKAKAEYKECDENWDKVEDGVKEQSKDSYKAIEEAMDQVKNTLVKPTTPDKDKAIAALESLSKTLETHKTSFK